MIDDAALVTRDTVGARTVCGDQTATDLEADQLGVAVTDLWGEAR